MNNTTLPQTTTRSRRTTLGLVFATVILGGTLTACGGGGEDTTCGDFSDMNAGERRDVLEDVAEDSDDSDADAFLDSSDEEKDALADIVATACESQEDDTKLKDIE